MPLIVKGEVNVYPGTVITYEDPVHLATGIIIMSSTRIGAFSYFGERTILGSADSIGRFCSIAPGVSIGLGKHPTQYLSTSPIFFRAAGFFEHPGLPDIGTPRTAEFISHGPRIGHDVWIGANAIIGRGVTIGTGAIIAAGAFVRDDVRPYTIVGGTPAREIGQRFDDATIARLLRTEWWDYDLSVFEGVDVTDVPGQIGRLEDRIAARDRISYDLWEAGGDAA